MDSMRQLRERIERLEGFPARGGAGVVATALAEVDRILPWGGFPRGTLHEFFSPDPGDGTALRFLLRILARLMVLEPEKSVLWAAARIDVFAPGLHQAEVDAGRLIFARCLEPADLLFALEEGLRCSDLVAVVGEVAAVDFVSSRRLQLAAQTSGSTLLLLRPAQEAAEASAAATRWKISSVAAEICELQLLRCRGGRPTTLTIAGSGDRDA
jgi:protein ImuA